jgi:hypothetical protein
MVDGLIGVAIGAAFAPLWIKIWGIVKSVFTKKVDAATAAKEVAATVETAVTDAVTK